MNLEPNVVLEIILDGIAEEGVIVDPANVEPTELRLVGREAVLKSVQLVSLLVGIEQRLQEEWGISLSLMDEDAMSQSSSPFRSVGSLQSFICTRIGTPGV